MGGMEELGVAFSIFRMTKIEGVQAYGGTLIILSGRETLTF